MLASMFSFHIIATSVSTCNAIIWHRIPRDTLSVVKPSIYKWITTILCGFPARRRPHQGEARMFLCGVVRHAVISPYPSRRFSPPSAWRWVRPRDILGTRAAVPFVNKPLWFYASSPKTHITRNSEYLCVVLAICETKAQNGTAQSSIALVCNVTCFLSLSLGCQYGTQRTALVAAACRRYERHQQLS